MSETRVLVFGLRGLATEICKNIVLAGIGDVTIIDDSVVSMEDLGCQFFLREQDVGARSRAAAAADNLQALNPLAKVHVETGEASSLTEDRIKLFDLICVTGMSLSNQRKVDAACRKHGVRFFAADCHGLFASIFLDLNTHDYTIEKKRKNDDATQQSTTEEGRSEYPSLEGVLAADWSALKRASLVLFALHVQRHVHDARGRYASGNSDGDAEAIAAAKEAVRAANRVAAEAFDDELIRLIGAQGELEMSAVCSIVGGMAADQIIKAVTGREKPLSNLFLFDGREGMGAVYDIRP